MRVNESNQNLNKIINSGREIKKEKAESGNTKRGSITVPLTSCLTSLD
jgi:hypothetical protein